MCLIAFAWRPGHAQPLIVAANRDEFYARPTAPLAAWPDAPGVCAGRDLEAGGTWLGIGPAGRFAAVTNIRGGGKTQGQRSRGELCAAYLKGDCSLQAYAHTVHAQAGEYAGFNLLLGDRQALYYLSSHTAPEALGEGVYGLSNAGLNTPWSKLLKARAALADHLADTPDTWFDMLANPELAADADLPQTGVGLVTERLLSSIFIANETYGTRASTVLVTQADGARTLIERSFGPGGRPLGEVKRVVPA
ncbi:MULTISPECIES: NRDE family protein [Pseudomonas]|uniref:NRDE family protein n=1 Tax=Pseudomonas quercus TaxID=2722792 RepID=A0ABX0YGW1_9PSED|nr:MULTISPECIES: NRDE family protein [Pseudomonas]MBF7144199.1 NRDE family protein [Pseudomonas sp. LY10J]NJP02669.1 hypothetical protein [Pseudomonas quercus]